MSGGKGGTQSTQVQIPAWMEDAARRNLARAEAMSKVGYQPYYGTDVVGFGPTGDMARQANIDAAIAFGMAPEGTKATPMGDMSSGTLYDQAVAEAARRNPGQEAYYSHFFIDPVTGAMSGYDQAIAERAARDEMLRRGIISPVLYSGGSDGRGGINAGPVQESEFLRNLGFGLYDMPVMGPFSLLGNLAGASILDGQIDAIDRGFQGLPTTTGGGGSDERSGGVSGGFGSSREAHDMGSSANPGRSDGGFGL